MMPADDPKRVLIVGAGGFTGGFLVEDALANGYQTWAGIRKSTSRSYLLDERIHFVEFDLDDEAHLAQQLALAQKTMGGWHYIIYNLGVTKANDASTYVRVNFHLMQRFVETLRSLQMVPLRFLFMSSLSALGAPQEASMAPISHHDTPVPNTSYGRSKLMAEEYLKSIPDFPYIILRPTGIYGPRDEDYTLFIKLVRWHITFVAGYKPQVFSYLYIRDLTRVVYTALEQGVNRRSYLVSDGLNYSPDAYAKCAANILKINPVLVFKLPLKLLQALLFLVGSVAKRIGIYTPINPEKYPIYKQRNWSCDITPLRQELGFSPRYTLEQGVAECVAWYTSTLKKK